MNAMAGILRGSMRDAAAEAADWLQLPAQMSNPPRHGAVATLETMDARTKPPRKINSTTRRKTGKCPNRKSPKLNVALINQYTSI